MRDSPVPKPRRIGKHVSAALDLLEEIGAGDVQVFKTRHVVVAFTYRARRFEIFMPCTPQSESDQVHFFRQALNRTLTAAYGRVMA